MVVVNSIVVFWVEQIGGVSTLYNIFSLLAIFTLVYVFYRIVT